MYDRLKEELIHSGIKLDKYGLIALSGGNLSTRTDDGSIIVTPSGMDYDTLCADDMVVLDPDGKVIEGQRRPSVDTVALLHIYKNLSEVDAVIHTHQIYATAIGLVEDRLPAVTTFLANATLGDVTVAPYSSAASEEMGVQVVRHLGGKRAVILRNHGVVTVGKSIREALYAAIYLEDAAKCYVAARTLGTPIELDAEQVRQAVKVFQNYGQHSVGRRS